MQSDSMSGCPFAGSMLKEEPEPPSTRALAGSKPVHFTPVPVARAEGRGAIPGVEMLLLLRGLLKDPAAQLETYRQRYGNIFTYPLRPVFAPMIYYVFSLEAYRTLLDMPPEDGLKAGPVRTLIPTLTWFPRSRRDTTYMEELVVHGRAFIGTLLKEQLPKMASVVSRTLDRAGSGWREEIDLTQELVDVVYDCSVRCVVGDAVWDRIGAVARPALRKIARNIEIPRIVLGQSPLGPFTPEYRAIKDLHRAILDLIKEHRRSGAYPILDQIAAIRIGDRPLPPDDVPWMLHYILWSAVTYPGTYGFWSFVDIISRPRVLGAVLAAAPTERLKLLRNCVTETMRINPVITLARMTTQPIDLECDGRWYHIPADCIVIVTPFSFNSDPERFEEPKTYNPWRYENGGPSAHVFGRGAYGCVAQHYVYALLGSVLGGLLDRWSFSSLEATVPERKCNVHLVYPLQPFRAQLKRRTAAMSGATRDNAWASQPA